MIEPDYHPLLTIASGCYHVIQSRWTENLLCMMLTLNKCHTMQKVILLTSSYFGISMFWVNEFFLDTPFFINNQKSKQQG